MFRTLRLTTLLILSVIFTHVNAQVQTARYVSMISNSGGYYEYLPQGYNSSNQTYPLIIFLHGVGELGAGTPDKLPLVKNVGIPMYIDQGKFPTSFTVNGQTSSFIVISPQFIAWPSLTDINNIIDYAIKNYRVNTNRI